MEQSDTGRQAEPTSDEPARHGLDSPSLLVPGETCWRIEQATRAAFLIDGDAYFRALRQSLLQAERSVFVLGWDIDSRMRLPRLGRRDRLPENLADLFDTLVRRKPTLQAFLLCWDFAVLYATERDWLAKLRLDWMTHPRLHFLQDDCHPVTASHHQKVVVIDDKVAYVGGFDLALSRWDTPAHRCRDPHRTNPDGKSYAPFHDVQMVVEGPVAAALGELARERWRLASGRELLIPAVAHSEPWPAGVTAELTDVPVAIARTEPAHGARPAVAEIQRFYQRAIAAARRSIYLENQYFTSEVIGTAIAERLAAQQGPEVVLVQPQMQSGWLEESTMGVMRARLHKRLREADRHGRFLAYFPQIEPGALPCLSLHTKLMTVDDRWLTIGSANLSNRSMGLDTECNVLLEAHGEPHVAEQISAVIRNLRQRLLAEHLDVTPALYAERESTSPSMGAAIETVRRGDDGRTLVPAVIELTPELDALLPARGPLDPEQPLPGERLLEGLVPPARRHPVGARLAKLSLLVLAIALLAAAWRTLPMHEYFQLDRLVDMGRKLGEQPLAPVVVLGAYVLACLVVVPITLLIAMCGLVFGPWVGLFYALAGTLLGATANYAVGACGGSALIRRFGGERLNKLDEQLADRGVVAVAVVRVMPIAPFAVVNMIAGASRISLRDFVTGTALGMAPGIFLTVIFVDRVVHAMRNPSLLSTAVLGGVAALIVGVSLLARRWLHRRQE